MKTYLKKQNGYTLIELLIVVGIISVISSIAIPLYKDYMIHAKWGKTIAGVRALKLAIENCLSDTNAVFSLCDDLSEIKIGAYGVTQYASANGDYLSVNIIPSVAGIKVTGDTPLANCILTITPSYYQNNSIAWTYTMTSGSASTNAVKCSTYVKGSVAS